MPISPWTFTSGCELAQDRAAFRMDATSLAKVAVALVRSRWGVAVRSERCGCKAFFAFKWSSHRLDLEIRIWWNNTKENAFDLRHAVPETIQSESILWELCWERKFPTTSWLDTPNSDVLCSNTSFCRKPMNVKQTNDAVQTAAAV